MSFFKPVSRIQTTKLNASSRTPLCSASVKDGTWLGRHAIEVTALDTTIYLGSSTVSSTTGRPIAAGESVQIPVSEISKIPGYVIGGNCILTEYF